MIVAYDLEAFPSRHFRGLVLTLGTFDGVHRGHVRVLDRVRTEARKCGAFSAVLTFREHPTAVLHPGASKLLLTSFLHKLALIGRAGIDLCLVPHFDRSFSRMGPEEFVKKVLVDKLRVKKVILGHDARFGCGRTGDTGMMASLAAKYGFCFSVVHELKRGKRAVKSTRVRKVVSEGGLREASRLLGRPFSVLAKVVKGDRRGRKLGFPTANLYLENEILPPFGVYAVRVRPVELKLAPKKNHLWKLKLRKGRTTFRGLMNWGLRPTFAHEAGHAVAEVHLVGFRGDLYGKVLEVVFLRRLRGERKFSSPESLNRRIRKDIEEAENFF